MRTGGTPGRRTTCTAFFTASHCDLHSRGPAQFRPYQEDGGVPGTGGVPWPGCLPARPVPRRWRPAARGSWDPRVSSSHHRAMLRARRRARGWWLLPLLALFAAAAHVPLQEGGGHATLHAGARPPPGHHLLTSSDGQLRYAARAHACARVRAQLNRACDRPKTQPPGPPRALFPPGARLPDGSWFHDSDGRAGHHHHQVAEPGATDARSGGSEAPAADTDAAAPDPPPLKPPSGPRGPPEGALRPDPPAPGAGDAAAGPCTQPPCEHLQPAAGRLPLQARAAAALFPCGQRGHLRRVVHAPAFAHPACRVERPGAGRC